MKIENLQDFRRVYNLSSPQVPKHKASSGTIEFNEVVAMDLKIIENKQILCCSCG